MVWFVVAAFADEFELQALGQPLQGMGWSCVEGADTCTRTGRLGILPGTWTAKLDEHREVVSIGFMALWVGRDFPVPAPTATVAADPWAVALVEWRRVGVRDGWHIVERREGDSALAVLERLGERLEVTAWSSDVAADAGTAFQTAVLYVGKYSQ